MPRQARKNTYENNLKQHLLVDLHEFLVPLFDIGGSAATVRLIILCRGGVVAVMFTPFDDLAKHSFVYLSSS